MGDDDLKELLGITKRLGSRDLVEAKHRVLALKSIYRLYQGNLSDLRDLLEHLNDPDTVLPLLDIHHRARLDQTLDEVERRFHNFMASAGSLVDHTRRHVRRAYPKGSRVRDQYERGLDLRFRAWDVAHVVKGLRNYVLHRELPVTYVTVTWSQQEFCVDPVLNARSLLEWKKWSKPAREYLARAGDSVSISALTSEYSAGVAEFYNWFGGFQALHDLESIKELDRLEQRQAVLGQRLGFLPRQEG